MAAACLEGIRVLDLTNNYAGPTGTAILADFGAEVIHIERPVFGDDNHGYPPIVNGESWQFQWPNRGKKSIVIDMNDPKGVDLVKKLLETADILVESYRPGIMKRFGLDYETAKAIKPDIIYCSVSAYGQTGPLAYKPGFDLLAQAKSGIMDMTGESYTAPQQVGIILGDIVGGFNAYMAILTALYYRQVTGIGQYIDVSLYEGLVSMNAAVEAFNYHAYPTRHGNQHDILCPYGVFEGNDGSAVICAPNNKLWAVLCTVMGRPELIQDPDYAAPQSRAKNLKGVIAAIEGYLKSFEHISDAIDALDQAGIPCCKIAPSSEVLSDPHLIERGTVIDLPLNQKMQDAGIKTMRTRGPWLKLSETPQVMKQPPVMGQNNVEILSECGLSEEEINELEAGWVEKYTKKRK